MKYSMDQAPTPAQLEQLVQTPLWRQLCCYLEQTYAVAPSIEYSRCSGAPGWNVKYKKGGRALCTLYPSEGEFLCMVVLGGKEQLETDVVMPQCQPSVQEIYRTAGGINGGKWLMIPVTDELVLQNVKDLIRIRVKPKAPNSR